jgi:RNA polymerase sigma factor (sigma-70 family)
MTEPKVDPQHSIIVNLGDRDIRALEALVHHNDATVLRSIPSANLSRFCDFLIDNGTFDWEDSAQAAWMLDNSSLERLAANYLDRVVTLLGELDDLSLVGGDDGFSSLAATQLMALNEETFGKCLDRVYHFILAWEATLSFHVDEWPELFYSLDARAADARSKLRNPRKTRREQLFEEITARYTALISRIALSYEADPTLRRDLVQDILLAIWVALAGNQEGTSLRSFVASIAQKRSISHVTKRAREPHSVKLPEDLQSVATPPDEVVIQGDLKRHLVESIQLLPIPQRQAIVLCFEGFSYREVAEILGISTNAAMLRCQKAKSTLRSLMAERNPLIG